MHVNFFSLSSGDIYLNMVPPFLDSRLNLVMFYDILSMPRSNLAVYCKVFEDDGNTRTIEKDIDKMASGNLIPRLIQWAWKADHLFK